MVRRCLIILRLIIEAEERRIEDLEDEIRKEMQLLLYRIPWVATIEVVKVSQE